MESKKKYNIMPVKKWIKARPQFILLYCPDTFVKMARRLSDKKDFRIFSIIPNFPNIGEEFHIEHFMLNEIYVEYSTHHMETGEYLGTGKIEINLLP